VTDRVRIKLSDRVIAAEVQRGVTVRRDIAFIVREAFPVSSGVGVIRSRLETSGDGILIHSAFSTKDSRIASVGVQVESDFGAFGERTDFDRIAVFMAHGASRSLLERSILEQHKFGNRLVVRIQVNQAKLIAESTPRGQQGNFETGGISK